MPTPVEILQAHEAGHSQVPAPVAIDREYLGKAPSFLIADHFAQCCRGWFSIEAARLLDIDPDGALYSRIASAVGRNSALQLNALIAARLDAFLAGVFCGRRDAVTAAIVLDVPTDRQTEPPDRSLTHCCAAPARAFALRSCLQRIPSSHRGLPWNTCLPMNAIESF